MYVILEDSGGGGCCCGCKLLRGLGPPPLPDDNIVDVVLGLADESLEIVDDAVVAGVIVGAILPPAPPPPDAVAALAATPATRDVTKDAKLDVQLLLLLLLPPSAIAVAVFPPLLTALPMTEDANGCAPKMVPEEEGDTCSCNGCAKVVLLELLPLLSSDVLV